MSITDTTPRLSRRGVLKGLTATAGVMAVAGCAPDGYDGSTLLAMRALQIPTDPLSPLWDAAPAYEVELGPQDIALPYRLEPTVSKVSVRAIHDGRHIGFRLEWSDEDSNDLAIKVDQFRDACAVMLVPGQPNPALRPMGSLDTPATLLHWKADWQRDVDEGRQGLDAVYPNRRVDTYPAVWESAPSEVGVEEYEAAGATEWVPGYHVGNPISMGGRGTPVEKAIAYGFSTTTTAVEQDVDGRGSRSDSGWVVTIIRSLAATSEGELDLSPGSTCSCAFAVWSGAEREGGGRKAPSRDVHVLTVAE